MKITTTRVETFSDGVIAIIITIMVLQLKLPNLDKGGSTVQVINHLKALGPYLFTYAFSFMMIGIFWTNHHHMFHLLEKTDEQLLWQNFLFLFLLSLIPLATAIVGASPFITIAPVVYGIVMLATTLSFVIMRNYSHRKKLIHQDKNQLLNEQIIKVSHRARIKAIIGACIYLISIPLAYINVYLSYACFIIPPIIFFIPEGIDNEKMAQRVGEKNA